MLLWQPVYLDPWVVPRGPYLSGSGGRICLRPYGAIARKAGSYKLSTNNNAGPDETEPGIFIW